MDDSWTIVNTRHDLHTLGQFNSVCTVSNGYLGLKGNLAEQRDGYSPVTLINGVYDELDMFSLIRASNEERRYLDARYFDSAGKSPAVANLPDPLRMQVFVNEREISFSRGGIENFEQRLDMSCGLYTYRYDYRDGWGHVTRIEMQRFASLRHAHRVFMRYTITPLDYEGAVRIHSGISGSVFSNTTRERQFAVTELWTDPPEHVYLAARTNVRQTEVRVALANVVRAGEQPGDPIGVAEHDEVFTRYTFQAKPGQPITLERHAILSSGEDLRHHQVIDIGAELSAAVAQGFDAALVEQRDAWQELWNRSDVQIEGDDQAQTYLRFCLFHLLQGLPRFTDCMSVPVKLLTGEYYQGNTFYDTDTYILPFITFTQPEHAQTCLNWRVEGLRPGREIARNLGFSGAKLAWQAGPYGEECLGRWWRFTHTNIHINGDAAYALMQYAWASNDTHFLFTRGVDLLVETARFYASRARHDKTANTYHLDDVAGPDEGHCESRDNFYTNYLAKWNLLWAADLLARMQTEDPAAHQAAVGRLNLRSQEPAQWRAVAEGLAFYFDPQTRVYEQCVDFYKLKEVPKDLLDTRKVWFATVFPYQALNQPDVLMAMMMFRDTFTPDVYRANYEFYYDKSMNFSSMSFVINSIVSADMGDLDRAYRDFVISAGEDVDEELTGRKDTFAGLHGTAAGGAWMAAVMGFGGLNLSDQGLRINPNLPPQWQGLRYKLVLQGVEVAVEIDAQQVKLTTGTQRKLNLPIRVAGQEITLQSGQTYTVKCGK